MKTTVTLFIFLTVFSLNTFAQDFAYTRLVGHKGDINSVSFSPDGRTLASVSDDDNKIHLWDVATGDLIDTFTVGNAKVNSVAFSPDGQMLAGGFKGTRPFLVVGGREFYSGGIHLWDIATGEKIKGISLYITVPISVAFSPDGQMLAVGGEAITYGTRGGQPFRRPTISLYDVATHELRKVYESVNTVPSVAFSPDGEILASVDEWRSDRGEIDLWDPQTGERTHENLGYAVTSNIAFSPDGEILASGDGDGYINLWDPQTGERTHRFEVDDWVDVLCVAFSPDGEILASGNLSGDIDLWDPQTRERIHTLKRDGDRVNSIAFSSDGLTFASGGQHGSLRLYKLPKTRIRVTPDPVVSPAIGEQFTVDIGIVAGENVGGYQVSLGFDETALRYVESANGKYLSPGAFFVPPVVSVNTVTLGATALTGVSNGDGVLATVTLEVVDVKESKVALSKSKTVLTNSAGEHLPHLAYSARVEPSLLTSSAIVSITPSSVLSPAIGEELVFKVEIAGGQNVTDFQLTLDFDPLALERVPASYDERIYVSRFPDQIQSQWSNYFASGVGNGDGTLATVIFEVLGVRASTVRVSGYLVAPNGLRYTPIFESAEVTVPLLGDVNRDGVVNILDLVLVASKFGQQVSGDPADVNEDGIVNIVDLVKVAGALGDGAAAPTAAHLGLETALTRVDVQQWLTQAQQLNLTDATSRRGILFLEQLLAILTPKETGLLPNYPNPFNPETWMPYQLAEASEVWVSIYAVDGTLVRQLELGHQPVGIYEGKSRAAYWDGRNAVGEPVASGVYFYRLTAGDFSATRRMLILK